MMHCSSLKCTTTTAKTSRIIHAEPLNYMHALRVTYSSLRLKKEGNNSSHIDEGGNFDQPKFFSCCF